MASLEDVPKQKASRKLQPRSRNRQRLPSTQIPSRLRLGDDSQDDVTAPDRGNRMSSQYMNQSIFSMIAAAGSRADFHTRFDDSSDSSDDIPEEEETAAEQKTPRTEPRLSRVELLKLGRRTTQTAVTVEESAVEDKKSKRLSVHKLGQSLPQLSLKSRKGKEKEISVLRQSSSPASDSTSKSSRSNPREAPVMSRLLTAEAEFQAKITDVADQPPPGADDLQKARSRADSSTATLLATRLMEIFGFERPEKVVAEYPCWLLQSVLLQGYFYITTHHICFYAYLPKKSNTVSKTGYLSKKGRSHSKYRRYWFSLKGDVLSYYSNPSDLYFPQGNIDLRYGISAVLSAEKDRQKDCNEFSVTTDHRTYQFRADSPTSAKEWVTSLQKTIFRSHNDGDSVKISLPVDNIIDIEESPVVEFAETVKIRVIESGDSYAIDEYFFSFFSFGEDVLNVLGNLVRTIPRDTRSPPSDDEALPAPTGRRPPQRPIGDRSAPETGGRSTTPPRDGVRTTLVPFALGEDGKMSPKMSGEFPRLSNSPVRSSGELSPGRYGRASFDRGRRSGSTSRLDVSHPKRTEQSCVDRQHDSSDSFVQSVDRETDSSAPPLSPRAEAQMSASQILSRSDVFHTPRHHRMDTLVSVSTEPTRRSSEEGTVQSGSPHPENVPAHPGQPPAAADAGWPSRTERRSEMDLDHQPFPRDSSSPALQDLVKAGSYPLQRAGALADYLKNRSSKMSRLLATESMSYLEKVSGMWAGSRRHYGENEGVVPDDRDVDPEDEEANVGHGDRFRAHFALPTTEKLQATYFGFLHRVLPLYGKIYISDRKFCFRSLLPGTRTKLILPLKDIENVDKEKGFRFGYHGLVLVIRGHEELFFEFSSSESRDDCTVTLLHSLESVRYMAESGLLAQQDENDAAVAKEEHRMLEEARKTSTSGPDLVLPETNAPIYSHEEPVTVLFDETRAPIGSLKPTESLRITCLTVGSRGDVQPYIALCRGLLAEGHRPKIATHAEFAPWIQKYGIEFEPVEGDPAELMRLCIENDMFTYSFLREASAKFRQWIDELLSSAWRACQGSDLLIESPSAMAGIHIAEALGIPYFRAFSMPWTRTRAYPHAFAVPDHKVGGAYNYFSYVMFDNVFWKGISGQVNRWRKKELGLRSTSLDKMQPNKVPFLYSFSPQVVPPPLDYSDWVRITGFWFLDEAGDWTPPQDLVAFIQKSREENKKLVYIGFGSIVVSDPSALTQTVVESVLKADVYCILAKGWSDRLGDPAAVTTEIPLPPQIHQIRSAPHDWLFRQVDAVVHHGGAGTTGASLRAGVPTVIKPFFGDQFFFGSRVEDLGVGLCLKKINVSLFSRALWEAVHSERMIVKARLLGQRIRQENGVQTAIQAIYRDLDYAKTLIKARPSKENTSAPALGDDDGGDLEESWTFIGDETDPDLQRLRRQTWEAASRGQAALQGLAHPGPRPLQDLEPMKASAAQ